MKAFACGLLLLLLHFTGTAQTTGAPSQDQKPRSPNARWLVGGFSVGGWLPQNDLQVLGAHPSLGVMCGIRDPMNELDINVNIRFVRTPQDYKVQRNDSLYSRHYYFGGYVGLDYTRYVFFSNRCEIGAVVGLGYDLFDIANSDDEEDPNPDDYLQPTEIGTFNYNLGIRLNYFTKKIPLSIVSKYNFLRYTNSGGSSLFGNAISVELLIGL